MKGLFVEFLSLKGNEKKTYNLFEVFGCPEVPPPDCPTYLVRDVHDRFNYAIKAKNIIVVYGESKQGKTWTIERFCPNQLRIGCAAKMTLNQIKKQMLTRVGANLYPIEEKTIDVVKAEGSVTCLLGEDKKNNITSGIAGGTAYTTEQTIQISPIDISDDREVLEKVKELIGNRCFVIDNFHYLSPDVQHEFCALLKECNYYDIKIIIVGIWKEASKITALAPDLGNRCEHIDIGNWSEEELLQVTADGERALAISIDDEAKREFISYSANNVGIYKDFLSRYCARFSVYETQNPKRLLKDSDVTKAVVNEVISEMLQPLRDRVINLAKPQRKKKDYKLMRLKIVVAILSLICESESVNTRSGITLDSIQAKLEVLCNTWNESKIHVSNLTQELGVIHEREENKQTEKNFIPLFFFDKINKKLLILEPALYVIKAFDVTCLEAIIGELETYLNASQG